jgi:hypothetical protein
MIFSEVICTELAFRLTTTWCTQPFYVPVPATGKKSQVFRTTSKRKGLPVEKGPISRTRILQNIANIQLVK